MVKKTLLLCTFLFCILAIPVQSQAPAQVTDPTTLADCGLPVASSQFTSASNITTFNMTADCAYTAQSAQAGRAILYITSGEFTINGNGHSIIGPSHTHLIYLEGANVILNLNDVTIRESSTWNFSPLNVYNGATLNGRNLTVQDTRNTGSRSMLWINGTGGTQVNLRNAQFLNNRQTVSSGVTGSAIYAFNGATVTITNGIFRGNRNAGGRTAVITATGSGTSVQLNGCMTFEDNVQADGTAADDYERRTALGGTATVTDSSTGACPRVFSYWAALTPQKKSKKTATPRPSATARPLATTCIDLNQATGIVVHATYGLASGVQCQRLGGGGIGVQAIVDGGFIDAVDIWGYVEQGVEVCFPQAGELLFLDARTMPRAVAPLAATVVNGMTCGAVETPGSIVLMPAG